MHKNILLKYGDRAAIYPANGQLPFQDMDADVSNKTKRDQSAGQALKYQRIVYPPHIGKRADQQAPQREDPLESHDVIADSTGTVCRHGMGLYIGIDT